MGHEVAQKHSWRILGLAQQARDFGGLQFAVKCILLCAINYVSVARAYLARCERRRRSLFPHRCLESHVWLALIRREAKAEDGA